MTWCTGAFNNTAEQWDWIWISAHVGPPHTVTSSSLHQFRASGRQPGPPLWAQTPRPELIADFNKRGAPALSVCKLIKYSLFPQPRLSLKLHDADGCDRTSVWLEHILHGNFPKRSIKHLKTNPVISPRKGESNTAAVTISISKLVLN